MTLAVVLGIDTHKDLHIAVLLNELGRRLGDRHIPPDAAGTRGLITWASQHGVIKAAGVEGTGSYGYQLACQLRAAGIAVVEVNRPDRSKRRRKGKNDLVDAESAGREDRLGPPLTTRAPQASRPTRPPTSAVRGWPHYYCNGACMGR
jgi:transposase